MLPTLLQPPPHTGRVSTGLLILRVVLGLAFIQYGLTKVGHPLSWADPLAIGLPSFIQPLVPLTFEKNVFYEAGALALLFCGPGAYSIDALLARYARDAMLLPSRR